VYCPTLCVLDAITSISIPNVDYDTIPDRVSSVIGQWVPPPIPEEIAHLA